ncbi:ABC-2 type transport system permease protein [Actinoplanes campanulatus]|uniref:Transport permease protein n=1 Tax=Actinoplanes campanulatus TaxID=113559 RepID=A0A7W5FF29_9ACTN|nr:ABC transporter permease [Actinoplanes campanulatus]MBB3096054.1 ABC-2 type transport system permease protein [Actinoplanes campanulatus]GGN13384.1 transport permease protein [Actinoplanes campanulatus]GID36852.1 transport permease protein [Actinoplanes campanulatus]
MTTFVSHTFWMTNRRLKVLVKQPAFVLILLVQPAIWLFLFGNLFRRVVELPGFGAASYLDYLIPGVVVMTAVSSNMWAGMGMLEEIERGTMNRLLTTPVARSAIMNAAVVEQALSTTVQVVAIILLGLVAGAEYPGGPAGLTVLTVAAILLGTIFSALSNTIGMLARQRETIIGINSMLLLPLTFLSSAFMAETLMPEWMRTVAAANPVNWALDAARAAMSADPEWGTVLIRGGWLLAAAVAMLLLSTRTFRAYQKSV